MKKILLIVGIIVVVVLAGVLVLNKTFIRDYYEITNDQGDKARITTLQYSFFVGEPEKHTAVFYRLGDRTAMQEQIYRYVENLTSCYDDGAFCDTEQNFTIYDYQVSEGFLIHKITLVYDTIDLKETENATGIDIQTVNIGGRDIPLREGDAYLADGLAAVPTYSLYSPAQTRYAEAAVTGRGVTIGDTIEEIATAYSIKKGYALWEVQKKPQSDTTFVYEQRKYTDPQLDTKDVQLATLYLVYYRLEGQWIPLTSDEINQYLGFLAGESEKPYDGILMIQFQFPFSGYSNEVADGTLGRFSLDYESQSI